MIFSNSGRFVEPNGMNIFRARIARCNAAASQKREKRKARRKGSESTREKGHRGHAERERKTESLFFKSEHPKALFSLPLEENESFEIEENYEKNVDAFDEGALPVCSAPPGTSG